MNYETVPALVMFAFVSSVTPGPNNLMLMASGANFGFKRTIPHALGVGIGFTLMVFLVGIGIIKLFDQFPASYSILKVVSVGYLLYLAYKIAKAGAPVEEGGEGSKPLSFIQAALFQWVNPKAWTMALTAISLYAPSQSLQAVIIVAAIFGLINLPSVSSWVMLGRQMQSMLNNQIRLKVFNITMALLLVLSLYPLLEL
ncbi:LysE family translocator [Thalassomonas sp. M1454]|uniref:LysE family translocator n=1 Tax=Thalassomonas sp. M1454 TaxID=2594477 RepID=UPI001180554B|nr:LysE family translocator [Thalassomonas sp. M1454]TRX55207.1 LysE family translocator [Thalassomonas sp. M1454]